MVNGLTILFDICVYSVVVGREFFPAG